MITVIADDITGAAEMAGIGSRFGLRVRLLTDVDNAQPPCDLQVIATDTRSMSEEDAVAETRRIVRLLKANGATRELFKKTDSALRGHIVAELQALLEETSYQHVLFIPENPSKGRIVKQGVYYIDGRPFQETAFAYDPEFPANTSIVTQRLPGVQRLPENLPAWKVGDAAKPPIYIADAEDGMQIAIHVAKQVRAGVLLAGAADLFTAYLRMRFMGHDAPLAVPSTPPFTGLSSGHALIVCGSTQSSALDDYPYIRRHAIPTEQMPADVFLGKAPWQEWADRLTDTYAQTNALVLTIGYPSQGGKEFALRLRSTLSDVVAKLVEKSVPDELVIEGGATAYAILQRLGWKQFRVTAEVSPGVVRMQRIGEGEVAVTLKPGSYPWGLLFNY